MALNKIGLMSQADRRSVIRIECYSVARVALIIVSALMRVVPRNSALLEQCTSVLPLPAREGLVEPRRLELLTPSLQRRCSPN